MAEQLCACGCGQTITKGYWVPGHDHRAIHERIARDHGSVAEFIDWYDRVYPKSLTMRGVRKKDAPRPRRNTRAQ